MFEKFFTKYPDYKIEEKPTSEFLSKNKDCLHPLIIDFLRLYGFGTYMDGFLRFINPENYQDVFEEAYNNKINNEKVFCITAFGDCLGWTGKNIICVSFRYGTYNYISTDNINFFFERKLTDPTYLERVFAPGNYKPAKERLGDLDFDECFGYVPLLGLGGAERPENLEKVKIKEHIQIITATMGQIDY